MVYGAQPEDTRLDSFGVFPSRPRTVRLAVMGFQGQREVCSFLEAIGWPGEVAAVDAVIARFRERASIVRSGANIDVREEGVGPTLGLTLIVKQRYTKDSRYWIDGLTDWDPFLAALGHEELVVPEKLEALAGWASKPTDAVRQDRALRDAAGHSPHQAGHLRRSPREGQGVCLHGAFRRAVPVARPFERMQRTCPPRPRAEGWNRPWEPRPAQRRNRGSPAAGATSSRTGRPRWLRAAPR